MWKLPKAPLAVVLLSGSLLVAQTSTLGVKPPFQPPQTISVTDVPCPMTSLASGTVVLDVVVDENGNVGDVEVRRDIDSLTPVAVHAVKKWKFSPATFEGSAVASTMMVAVTFRPASVLTQPVNLPPLIARTEEGGTQPSFVPAEVTSATFPSYPNALMPGTVILEVTLNETGKPLGTKVLQDLPPFTSEAVSAVESWKFKPATFNGSPIQSKIVLAFVFRIPYTNPPSANSGHNPVSQPSGAGHSSSPR